MFSLILMTLLDFFQLVVFDHPSLFLFSITILTQVFSEEYVVRRDERTILFGIGVVFGFKVGMDYYGMKRKHFESEGRGLLRRYNLSPTTVLRCVLPEMEWKLWKFSKIPRFLWNDLSTQRQFLIDVEREMKMRTSCDWYKVSVLDIRRLGGGHLLLKYDNSVSNLVVSVVPEKNLEFWRFNTKKTPKHWFDVEHRKKFIDYVGKEKVEVMEDWYGVYFSCSHPISSWSSKMKNRGEIFESVYPEFKWMTFRFYDDSMTLSDAKYILEIELDVRIMDDWYKLKEEDIHRVGLKYLFKSYGKDIYGFLKVMFPSHSWKKLKLMNYIPSSHLFSCVVSQRRFFDKMMDENILTIPLVWHNVRKEKEKLKCHKNINLILSPYYHNSLRMAVSTLYPELVFVWKCGGRNEMTHRNQMLHLLSEKYNIECLEEWYSLSLSQIQEMSGRGMNMLMFASYLSRYYPHHKWEKSRFVNNSNKKSSQNTLYKTIKQRFHGYPISQEYHMKKRNRNGEDEMGMDIFIPSLSISFEYQGEQHYESVRAFTQPHIISIRDEGKERTCTLNGISLICVPFFWNEEMLSRFIFQKRKDIVV